jgi:hypothetical protein
MLRSRALYFALAAMLERFVYLKHTLGLILMFIGGKIVAAQFGVHMTPAASLAVTLLAIRRLRFLGYLGGRYALPPYSRPLRANCSSCATSERGGAALQRALADPSRA